MKKQLLLLSALFISILGFSQGIEFERGTWKEVLEKAKQTNKPIFVDVYTSWCGPCKKMSKDIFPLAEVGKEFNANFICYQIDAEKGEGIKVAKKYEVMSYPTYLFVKADGLLFSRSGGSMNAEKFIAVSKRAIADMNDPKPLSVWEKEYAEKKNDPAFLLDYMNKRLTVGKSNAELFDEYLALLPSDQRASDKIIELYQKESRNIGINSLAYRNLQENGILFFPKIGIYINMFMSQAINNSFREAYKNKNEHLLQQVVEANDLMPKTPQSRPKEEFYMIYYIKTNDLNKYISNATLYCDNSLMAVSSDSIIKMDKNALMLFEIKQRRGLAGKVDSTYLAQLRGYMTHANRDKYSLALNSVAWTFFEKVTDVKSLENALRWSKRSLDIYPDNQMFIDTYANLLYKLGQKENAIARETEAVNLARSKKSDTKEFEETLKKMTAGKKTWK
ncbi:MAG: thioredoxin domain-containing protein [Bacteriovorax sp.]|nr:thioredoxin domain-containing protein [Bacteriovorax sp.]